jgi:hypothetical protein
MDSWQRSAYAFAVSKLPSDERRHYLRHQTFARPFDEAVAKWAQK